LKSKNEEQVGEIDNEDLTSLYIKQPRNLLFLEYYVVAIAFLSKEKSQQFAQSKLLTFLEYAYEIVYVKSGFDGLRRL
jgi:hypothetical protein